MEIHIVFPEATSAALPTSEGRHHAIKMSFVAPREITPHAAKRVNIVTAQEAALQTCARILPMLKRA
jgi:hypothetical protein